MWKTRLPASRSSSVGPEGRFLFFHPKVKFKETILMEHLIVEEPHFSVFFLGGGSEGVIWQ